MDEREGSLEFVSKDTGITKDESGEEKTYSRCCYHQVSLSEAWEKVDNSYDELMRMMYLT